MRPGPKSKPLQERLLSKIATTDSGCWEFTGSLEPSSYGRVWSGGEGGRMLWAHRASWVVHRGEIPDGMFVCHACDNPPCVNPDHLFLGDHKDNMADMARKGRFNLPKLRGESHPGHMLTKQDVQEVRALHSEGVSSRRLGELYGVSKTSILNIINRKTWSHVA
ncbi:HNH endonuclease [Gordonia phage BrutonGaster]|uniref:HNH endonuclease n=1 Tax=Gordonia phage BrutonGaster TaxID=2530116 RepID=A0A482JKI0_9CAUD|nr:endonuclease [Gordonia phage BrutonGaster]QBP33292.1 HNH endonuclease [Gordonia phage BrutonGaster]